ncbi:type IV pilus assembly protein PilM [Candidatus Uhrbacteria bacterium]|nr:type IV pilus assembly protein PilM [Candidatus Uhrbacteria bacterium]
MPLFQKKEHSLLGVDIGTSSVKIVELERTRDRAFALVNYGFVEQLQKEAQGLTRAESSSIVGYIKAILEKTNFSTTQASAALPTYSVFSSLISLPAMSPEELDSAIHWEAKKIIPLPLEDIELDPKILNGQTKGKSGVKLGKKEAGKEKDEKKEAEPIRVLITGAAKDTVHRYTEIFQESGLHLVSLETEMIALSRSLIGNDTAEIMIVEIGANLTDIIVVEGGVPFLGRSIETGGAAMTRAIVSSLGISDKRAEQLKRDIGIVAFDEASGGAGVPAILKESLEPIVHEIRYTIDLYKSHPVTPTGKGTGSLEKIILTGGASLLPGLSDYLAKELDIRVILGDPWATIQYPSDLRPVLSSLGPKFSVALGLALREV